MRTLLLAVLAVGLPGTPALTTPANTAVIVNTGSTNTMGYSISVLPTGQALYAATGRPNDAPANVQHARLTKAQTGKLFHDLAAAMPLTQLPVTLRMRSASFGTSTYITYKGQRTPDLSAPADARGEALKADVTAIAAALNMKNAPRRPGPALTPLLPGH